MYELLAIFALFTLVYSATAGGISRTPISGAIIFTLFGLLELAILATILAPTDAALGAVVVGQSIREFTWEVMVYALLSLTVVRMIPVFLALTGTGLKNTEKLFVSWFGPRGLASIVFGVIVVNEHLPHGSLIANTVVATIVLSVIFHGLSANPLVAALARRSGRFVSGRT